MVHLNIAVGAGRRCKPKPNAKNSNPRESASRCRLGPNVPRLNAEFATRQVRAWIAEYSNR